LDALICAYSNEMIIIKMGIYFVCLYFIFGIFKNRWVE